MYHCTRVASDSQAQNGGGTSDLCSALAVIGTEHSWLQSSVSLYLDYWPHTDYTLTIIVGAFGQLSGNGLITYFLPLLLINAGITNQTRVLTLNFVNSVTSYIGALAVSGHFSPFCWFLISRFSRVPSLLTTSDEGGTFSAEPLSSSSFSPSSQACCQTRARTRCAPMRVSHSSTCLWWCFPSPSLPCESSFKIDGRGA